MMRLGTLLLCGVLAPGTMVQAQDVPAEYQQVLTYLGRTGDFKANVLKVNIPRNDLSVTVAGVKTPTPFGFGGWLAVTKGQGMDVMMGDLVLTQDQVNPVMSALLENGIRGDGDGKLAQIAGHAGERTGPVYKITVGRDDLKITEMGAVINARMGLNTWAAFVGTDQSAAIAGDVVMLANEVTPVLKALRQNGLQIVAIHHHMTGTSPTIFFLHYWGTGPAGKLAAGFRAALDELAKPGPSPAKH
jgi:hypothetical protein